MAYTLDTPIESIAPRLRGIFKKWKQRRQTPPSEFFWKKVSVLGPNECWAWIGAKDSYGYGFWHPDGERTKRWKAHRLAWVYTFGPIPEGMLICHKCDNPVCVNPYHLFLGTHKDNSQDMKNKGRENYRRGEQSPTAKLSEKEVKEIRAAHIPKTRGLTKRLSQKFGISIPQIYSIVARRKWKHVD